VTRRASLPGADELFRRTAGPQPVPDEMRPEYPRYAEEAVRAAEPRPPVSPAPALKAVEAAEPEQAARPRHDEKVTFYCTGSELTRLEKARLALRSEHKLPSDRGRIVRAALAEILDDFEAEGSRSALLRRLRSEG